MYSSEIWYMDFYEKILKGQLWANKSNSKFDLIDSLNTNFLEKVNLKFCKFGMVFFQLFRLCLIYSLQRYTRNMSHLNVMFLRGYMHTMKTCFSRN
jgi:hypothetical protein